MYKIHVNNMPIKITQKTGVFRVGDIVSGIPPGPDLFSLDTALACIKYF